MLSQFFFCYISPVSDKMPRFVAYLDFLFSSLLI